MEQTIRPGSMRSTFRPLVTNRSRNLCGNFATFDSFAFSSSSPSRYLFTDSRSILFFSFLFFVLSIIIMRFIVFFFLIPIFHMLTFFFFFYSFNREVK